MKNFLLRELLRGDWLIDINGNKSAIYSMMAINILEGKSVQLTGDHLQIKSISELIDSSGNTIDSKKTNYNHSVYAKVSMKGEILKEGNMCAWGANEIVNRLDLYNDDAKVKGIIFEIDSPGGSANAAGLFQNFSNRKSKPIVALVDNCCSLGYLAAISVADKIYADNTFSANIGSIGVVSSFITPTKKYFKDRGLMLHEIYAEENPDKNKMFTEAKKGNYDLIKKDFLSPMALQFQEFVKSKRPGVAKEAITGKTYTAKSAIELKLIDGISDIKKAIAVIDLLSTK